MAFNTWKAIIALTALVLVSTLMAIGSIGTGEGMPIFTLIVGYAVGNGVAAKQGKDAEPIIQKKRGSR